MSHWKDRKSYETFPDPINYGLIAKAVEYYEVRCGYRCIDVPWIVSEETMNITKPGDTRLFNTFDGCLVASGEQSFLHIRESLVGHGRCHGVKLQCVTPCFRDERYYDSQRARRQYFLKNELIVIGRKHDIYHDQLARVIGDAWAFFGSLRMPKDYIELKDTEEGKDILINGEEVGSYGIREHEDCCWIYGTGCAEPRLSYSLRLK